MPALPFSYLHGYGLGVEAQEVIHEDGESRGWGFEVESVVRAVPVVVMEEEEETQGALEGVGVGVSVSPLAERGLNEAFGLAVGLWGEGASEAMFENELGDRGPHGFGAVAGAVVGIDAFGLDAVGQEEGESGVEEGDGAAGGLVWEELGEGEAGVVVDGDVEELPAGALGFIEAAVDAAAWADDAGELFDVEMDEIAWERVLVAADGQRRFEGRETSGVTAQQTGDGGFGEFGGARDLEGREFTASQGEDPGHTERVGGSGGTFGTRTTVEETGGALCVEAREPLEDRAHGETEARGDFCDGLLKMEEASDHLGSTHGGQFGVTVTVHAAVDFGLVLISQPHLPKSSPHEQPIGTSHLGSLLALRMTRFAFRRCRSSLSNISPRKLASRCITLSEAYASIKSFSTRRFSMMNSCRSGVFLPMKKDSSSSEL
jgi:hypothetical protein